MPNKPPVALPARPRWVHAADVLTVLLVVAALQAVLFGGFQIPGLSISSPGRPLMLALVVSGLRLYLVNKASISRGLQGFCRWLEQPAGAGRQQRMDAVFIRTFDLLVVWVISVSYASTALLALSAYDAPVAIIAGTLVSTVVWFFTPARFTPARLATEWPAPGRPILPILLLVLLAALLFRTEPFRTMHGGEDQGVY